MATSEIASPRIGIERVLIATEFSHQSELALQARLDFARFFNAQPEVAYVLPPEEYALAGADGLSAGREAARRDLLALKSRLRRIASYNDDTVCQVTMLEGDVAGCLLGYARQGEPISSSLEHTAGADLARHSWAPWPRRFSGIPRCRC